MATPSLLRTPLRRILGRDRLEIVEQLARQTNALGRSQEQRIADLEAQLRSAVADVATLSTLVSDLHQMLIDTDPAMTREVVDAVRVDVGDLVTRVNQLLAQG